MTYEENAQTHYDEAVRLMEKAEKATNADQANRFIHLAEMQLSVWRQLAYPPQGLTGV